jgi:hypothetical protein
VSYHPGHVRHLLKMRWTPIFEPLGAIFKLAFSEAAQVVVPCSLLPDLGQMRDSDVTAPAIDCVPPQPLPFTERAINPHSAGEVLCWFRLGAS